MSEPLVNDPAPSPAMELLRENALAAALAVLLLLNLAGLFQYIFGLDTAIVITLLAGYKTFYNSISALLEKRVSADLALCVAVIAALWVGEYRAAAEAMLIVMVGETLESYAAGRTEAAIRRFVAQLPRVARLWANGREVEVDAATLAPGDRIVVRAGERIAADGVIEQGVSSIDESSITGEPLPADKEPGTKSSPARSTATDCCASASPAPVPRPPWRAWRRWWRRLKSSAHPWSAWPTAMPAIFCQPCCWPARSLSISPATGCARSRC